MLYHNSVKKRLMFALFVVSAAVSLIISVVLFYADYVRDKADWNQTLTSVRSSVQPALAESVWTYDQSLLDIQVNSLINVPGVISARVFDGKDDLLADAKSGHFQTGIENELIVWKIVRTVNGKPRTIGHVDLMMDGGYLTSKLWDRAIYYFSMQAVKTFIVAAFMMWLIDRYLIRHLNAIQNFFRGGTDGFQIHPETKLSLRQSPGGVQSLCRRLIF